MTPSDNPGSKIGEIGANSAQLSFTGTELYRFEIPIDNNAFLVAINRERSYQIFFIPNKLDLTFRALNQCAKFHQNGIRIVAVGVLTDRLTE